MKKCKPRSAVLAPQLSIGIDLSIDAAIACVVDRDGTLVETWPLSLTRGDLRGVFADRESSVIVLEATTVSSWVARELEGMGHAVLVCNPRRLKVIASSTLKTDKLDAEHLGRLARLSQLDPALVHPVTVRSRETQLRRSELKARDQLVAMRTQAINFVRSVLRGDALPVPRCAAKDFAAKIDLEALPTDVRRVIEPLVGTLADLSRREAALSQRVTEMAAKIPGVERLTTIDGVGAMTAVAFALCLEDPKRFMQSRDVGPFLGLTPRLRQSAEQEHRGAITKQGDVAMRRLLVQAALCLLRTKRDSALKTWAAQLGDRRGKKKAIVALARKLAVVMHRMWITGEEYQPFPRSEASAAAA